MTEISPDDFPVDLASVPMFNELDNFNSSEQTFFDNCEAYSQTHDYDAAAINLVTATHRYMESYSTFIDSFPEDMTFTEFAVSSSGLLLMRDQVRVSSINALVQEELLLPKELKFPEVPKSMLDEENIEDTEKYKKMWRNGCVNLFNITIQKDVGTLIKALSS